ncbi:uncharacterized protein LOC144439501 [Glandiceps talaboti]
MDYESQGLLHDMFTRQAKLTPNNVAIVSDDGQKLTFRELDSLTDCLATNLRIKGVLPDSIVGIYMEKCIEYSLAYIAILKAGGAYLPIDISYPPPLLASVIEDSQPAAIVTFESIAANVKGAKNVIILDENWSKRLEDENSKHPPFDGPPKLTLDNLAYVVYSSGTTGKPKGIMCPHRGAVFSYHWRHVNYPFQSDERVACNVFFTWEMLRSMLKGIPLYIIPDNVIYDPVLLVDFLKRHEITRILFTPSLLEAVINTENLDISGSLKKLRVIWFCGEVVTTALRDRVAKTLPWIQLLNLYSISESHDVCVADLSDGTYNTANDSSGNPRKFCPVGKLLPGVQIVIMDDKLQPLPVGVPGEIYIAGPTLARGYLNRPKLNAERFINRPPGVPETVGDRLYRSGDWGYMLSGGQLEICGRCDSMVKIRGYSIETQAVEAALLDLPIVNAAVVLALGEEGTDKFLVAYIVPTDNTTKKEIRAELKKRLPFHMIPAYFVFLSSIPILAASGKLDKKALPPHDMDGDEGVEGGVTASTETEKTLVRLWCNLLNLKTVTIDENFFDLGGHSLLAARLLSLIRDSLNVELTVRDLFQHSTIEDMAKLIDVTLQHIENGQIFEGEQSVVDLKAEVAKHDREWFSIDMQLRAFWRSIQYGNRWKRGSVLLTGATGFLGVHLLKDLLCQTKLYVYCLVREPPDSSCRERLQKTLQQFGILSENGKGTDEQQMMMTAFTNRVATIQGDVSLLNMGMTVEDYTHLTYEVDFVIHSAAYVNLVYPYNALHGINVIGTRNVVLFACTNKIKPLHYISTNGVFPSGLTEACEDADITEYADKLSDGYNQSKWVAEQIVLRAKDRGLPVAIYRPGNLSGESKQAYWNSMDSNLLLIRGCVRTQSAPDVDWEIEMTPVDFVSNVIVQLTQNIMLGIGKVFHLVNPRPLKARWLFEWMKAHGYAIQIVPLQEWCKKIEDLKNSDHTKEDQQLGEMLDNIIKNSSLFAELSRFSITNLQSVLSSFNLTYPSLNNDLLKNYFHHLSQRNVIDKPKQNIQGPKPLKDRVAIVTGASSGIGAAVSRHLAQSGAMVALAARREEKLLELKRDIEKEGGVAITVKTDVCNRNEVKELVKHAESTLGPVDILVNNAGVMYYTMMKNVLEDQWEKTVDVNCKGVLNGIGAVLDGMISRGKGHIVNMSSDAGRRAFPGLAVYSGSKFFIEGVSCALRQELVGSGVKVTTIQPGDVKTEIGNPSTDEEAKEKYDMSSTYKTLDPDDIGRAVVYAVSQPPHVAVNEICIEPREAPAL